MTHAHLEQPELLELALAPGDDPRRALLANCATCAERAHALAQFAALARAAARQSEPLDQRLVGRILAATTREDLGLRGDLRLVWAFARKRLHASVALRVAAALVAIHVAALPVLAWIVLRASNERPHFNATVELPREPIYSDEPPEPAADLLPSVDEPPFEPRVIETEVPARDDASWAAPERRATAERLLQVDIVVWSARPPQQTLAALLWHRARLVTGEKLPAEIERDAPAGASIERAAWCELMLDRWALEGRRPARLSGVLSELASDQEALRSALVRLTLRRAANFGALAARDVSALARAEASAGAEPLSGAQLDLAWGRALAELRGTAPAELAVAIDAWSAALE